MEETTDQNKNKARLRRRISYAIALVLTVIIALTVYYQSRILPGRIADYANTHYLKGTPFTLSLDGVSGSFLRSISLENPTLRYHSTGASYNVFRADQVSVTYELLPLFAFRLIVDDVQLRNVAIHLRQDESGRLVLPFVGEKKDDKPGRFADVEPYVDVRHFTIDGLEMTFGGRERELAVRDVSLQGSVGYDQGTGRLDIESGHAYLVNSKKTVQEVRMQARTDGASLHLEDFAVRLDSSFVLAKGEFRDGRFHDVALVFNPLQLEELYQLGVAPEAEGRFVGRISLSGPVDSLALEGEVSGAGLGVELDDVKVAGTFASDVLNLPSMRGKVFGAGIDGSFRINVDTEDFVYDGTIADLDLSRGFIEDDEIPSMSLNGRVHVVHTKHLGRFEWRGELTRGEVDGYEAGAVSAQGVWEDATGLRIQRALLTRPGYRVTGDGQVAPEGDADIVFRVQGDDLSYFWEHFKLPQIGGTVDLAGRLQGPLDNFQVNLNGDVRDVTFEMFAVDTAVVRAEARNVGSVAPSTTVALEGKRGAISGRWFQSPSLLLDIDTSLVRVNNARFALGDTSVVVDLDVRARGKRSHIDVRHVTIQTPNETWTSKPGSSVAIDDGNAYIDSVVITSARGEFGAVGWYRERERTIDLRTWGTGVQLGMLEDAFKTPVRVAGTGDFSLALSGDARDPHIDGELAVRNGVIDSVAFGRLSGRASFDGTAYRVDNVVLVTDGDSMLASGRWDCTVAPTRLARGDTTGVIWTAPITAQASFRRFPLATVFDALHRPAPVSAAYTGRVTVGGTPDAPRITARGDVVPGKGEGRELPPANLDVEYADGKLVINRLALSDVLNARASGTFPLYLSFRRPARIDPDGPLSFKLDVTPGAEAAEVGRYFDGISLLRGKFSGSVSGIGTPAVPRLTGSLSVTECDLRVTGLKESFTGLALRLEFVDDVVRLSSLSAQSGKGSLTATGWARVSNYKLADYNADLYLRNFTLASIPDVTLRQDGHLNARLVTWRDGRRIPSLTGALDLREAVIEQELTVETGAAGGAEFTRPSARPAWIASIDLNAPKNVWIKNSDMTVEASAEEMILRRDELGLYFRGELTVLRGSYWLYGNKFQIESGTLNFSASETLRPEMNIVATTPVTEEDEEHTVTATFRWEHDKKEPEIHLSYDKAGYSESDVWALLAGNRIGAGMATNTIERALNQQMTGGFNVEVEQRAIEDSGTGSIDHETLVGVSKYLWEDNIYLQYRRGLSQGGEQEVNVEYRLGTRFRLRSQVIYNSQRNRAGIVGSNTDEYNLDLKYRFEY